MSEFAENTSSEMPEREPQWEQAGAPEDEPRAADEAAGGQTTPPETPPPPPPEMETEAEMPKRVGDAPGEVTPQAAPESDDSGEVPAPAKAPSKKLASGRPVRAGGTEGGSLRSAAGVATSHAIPAAASTRKRKGAVEVATAPAREGELEEFDPARDLPMYRPGMDWFVLRVASNKESYVRETLLKKVQIEGMQDLVGRIMVPTEKTKTLKAGRARITETKLYPGYVFVEMKLEPDGRIPQDVFFLIKETTGVGDFVGTAGRPTPMAPTEVEKMLFDSRKPEEAPTVKMEFIPGDHVTIKEGPFQNYDGTVDEVMPDKGKVRVLATIFGRQAPIELEYWQIAKAEG